MRVMDSVKVFGIYSPVLVLLGDVFYRGGLVLGGYTGTLLALVITRGARGLTSHATGFYNIFQSAMSALEKLSPSSRRSPGFADPRVVSPVLEKTGPCGFLRC